MKGLPDSVKAVFSQAIVQACLIHLTRATLRHASRKYWDRLGGICAASTSLGAWDAAWAAFEEFEEFEEMWGKPYPANTVSTRSGVRRESARGSSRTRMDESG